MIGSSDSWYASIKNSTLAQLTNPFANAPITTAAKAAMNDVFDAYKQVPEYANMKFDDFMSGLFEAHHILPMEVVEKSEGLRFYLNNCGTNCIDMNSFENAIYIIKKYVHEDLSCLTIHDSHLDYNTHLIRTIDNKFLTEIKDLPIPDAEKAARMGTELKKLINNAKGSIKTNCIKTNPSKINDLRPNF